MDSYVDCAASLPLASDGCLFKEQFNAGRETPASSDKDVSSLAIHGLTGSFSRQQEVGQVKALGAVHLCDFDIGVFMAGMDTDTTQNRWPQNGVCPGVEGH